MSIKPKGFTLLEILIALFVFTIVSVIMVGALHSVLTAQSRTENNARYFAQLQTAINLLSRDIEQTVNRQITNGNGVPENAFMGSESEITFTHAGLFNPFGSLNRSTLQRTRYYVKNEMLIRETWPTLDRTSQTKASDRPLLDHVTEIRFEFIDQNGTVQPTWPPSGTQTQSTVPRAVRVYLSLKQLGVITQLFLIPGYNNAPSQ